MLQKDFKASGLPAVLLLHVLLLFGCQKELPSLQPPQSGLAYVQASAIYHDPDSRWQVFQAEILEKSRFAGAASGWYSEILLNRQQDSFRYRQLKDGYLLTQTIGSSGECRATWPHPNPNPQDVRRYGLGEDPCRYIEGRRNFHDFLVGLPMVALEGEARFGESPRDTVLFGQAVKEVQIDFTDRENQPTWWLYIDPVSYRLVASRFVQPTGGGEVLHYPEDVEFDGFKLKARQTWYHLDASTPISVDSLSYSHPE